MNNLGGLGLRIHIWFHLYLSNKNRTLSTFICEVLQDINCSNFDNAVKGKNVRNYMK